MNQIKVRTILTQGSWLLELGPIANMSESKDVREIDY